MNAAEKAAQAKVKEQEYKIIKMFEEAQDCYEQFENNRFYYDDEGTLRSHIEGNRAKKKAKNSLEKAIKLFEKCAEEGHVESMEKLADLGKKQDYWCRKAAENGSLSCMQRLVWHYDGKPEGKQWEQRMKQRLDELCGEAAEMYRQCCQNSDLYNNGADIDAEKLNADDKKLLDRALKILTECAENEHVKSMEMLGQIYRECLHDRNQTFHWYDQGAKHGSALCMHTLGVFYRDGIGTEKDSYMSRYYFDMEKAANNRI